MSNVSQIGYPKHWVIFKKDYMAFTSIKSVKNISLSTALKTICTKKKKKLKSTIINSAQAL